MVVACVNARSFSSNAYLCTTRAAGARRERDEAWRAHVRADPTGGMAHGCEQNRRAAARDGQQRANGATVNYTGEWGAAAAPDDRQLVLVTRRRLAPLLGLVEGLREVLARRSVRIALLLQPRLLVLQRALEQHREALVERARDLRQRRR
eukprot:4706589-Prymnesium_polylepis.1